MSDILTPMEIRAELSKRFPKLPTNELQNLTDAFIDIAAGRYVSGKRIVKARRNKELLYMFTGNNYFELAEKFGLSRRHVRRLLSK